jgi:tRNA (guanine6-N2)-methyltransferase
VAGNQRRRVKSRRKPDASQETASAVPGVWACQAEVPPGLEEIAQEELARLGEKQVSGLHSEPREPGVLIFSWQGRLAPLLNLKTAHAVYTLIRHPVPRPKALLGHEHFHRLLDQIDNVLALWPRQTFQSLYLSAAGSDSAVMERIKSELSAHTGLAVASHEGDLLLRVRRPPAGGAGWETLVRISPRPLATRDWRMCNYEGALNAAVAYAMGRLTGPQPQDVFVNLACGSGSLLLERFGLGPARALVGLDFDPNALACARQNAEAGGAGSEITLLQADLRAAPLPEGGATALVADLPFGHLVGSHTDNLELYPQVLAEAARLAAPGARFVLISHEVRLMESLLAKSPFWATLQVHKIWLGGLNPRIFVLQRY